MTRVLLECLQLWLEPEQEVVRVESAWLDGRDVCAKSTVSEAHVSHADRVLGQLATIDWLRAQDSVTSSLAG